VSYAIDGHNLDFFNFSAFGATWFFAGFWERSMLSFPANFRALVIGASGSIGTAFHTLLSQEGRCSQVVCLHRQSQPPIDFDLGDSIAQAAAKLAPEGKFHLIIAATGVLHSGKFMPEKRLADLNYAQMEQTFRTNTLGPAMVLRHFAPLLDTQRGVLAVLSAKVGSIEDNRLGGWYSYRASKAALNMLLKTAAIEVKRSNPNAVLVALHPGTVNSQLSQPFRGAEIGRSPLDAAGNMLQLIDSLAAGDTGRFMAYDGQSLPW
jgi:NAD(P)-dependent dehydrogenase (short-subunit alcohol dehydrogenase family)